MVELFELVSKDTQIRSASSNPLPPLPLPIRPSYPNTAHGRTHKQRAVPINDAGVRLRIPEQLAADGAPEHGAEAPDEEDEGVDGGVLADAEDLGDEGGEEPVVAAGGDAVEHDEGEPQRERRRGRGRQDARQPEGEDAGRGHEEREDQRVLPPEPVARVARQHPRHGVDGVARGEEVGALGGGEAEDYGVGGDE